MTASFFVALADSIIEMLDRLDDIAEKQLRESCHECWMHWRDGVCAMQEGV